MPNWGSNTWMTSPPLFPSGTGGVEGPAFAINSPPHMAVNVPVSAPVRVALFSTLAPVTFGITINGVLAYDGTTLSADYAGFAWEFAGRTFIEVAPRVPFAEGVRVNVTVVATDTASTTTTTTWYFTPERQTSYEGNRLLNPESWLLQPMERFLELEPVRMAFLSHVLRDTAMHVPNRMNVAARALYQVAYESEISSLLSTFMRPDEKALRAVVPVKTPTYELVNLVDAYRARIDGGLRQLFESGALPREYRNNFADHIDSLLFNYRVSAVVVLLLLARAVEVAAHPAPPNEGIPDGVLLTEEGAIILTEDGFALEL